MALPVSLSTHLKPDLKDALCSGEQKTWRAAVAEELETLTSARTCEQSVEASPAGEKSIPSVFIVRLKRDAAEKSANFEARLVARGNMLSHRNVSADNVYAPVVSFETVPVLLIFTAAFGWSVEQMNIKKAYLCADLPNKTPLWSRLSKNPGDK